MADEKTKVGGPESDTASDEHGFSPGRRQALIVGSLLVPTIVTLHATPAWAQTDYTSVAYKYGDHKGKCRNPNFDDEATHGQHSREFIKCYGGKNNQGDSGF